MSDSANITGIASAMVVDDSAVQRAAVVGLLRELGIASIFEACDGVDALRVLATLPEMPELIIVDLEMPNMDGIELLQQFAERNIKPALIVASSREVALLSSVRVMTDVLELPVLGAMQKPLTAQAIGDAIQRFVAQPARAAKSARAAAPALSLTELRAAVEAGHVQPWYQPKVDLVTGRIKGVESLARWVHPERGLIPPDSFIGIAEREGYIHELTMHLVQLSCARVASWNARGFKVELSINLSQTHLTTPNLSQELFQQVTAHGLDPQQVIWEVTESAAADNLGAALGNLARLRLKGFGLSIDDYGTGFSSLQQLSRIPFSELKIDKSFIKGVHDREDLRVILHTALNMARQLNLMTVAEGIETEADLKLLTSYGCQIGQGYLFGAAVAGEKAPDWLAKNTARIKSLVLEK